MAARQLRFTAPETVEVGEAAIGGPGDGELLVETDASGISPGTELLVYGGDVPEDMAVDETIDALDGAFESPLRYGYAAVGTVAEAGAGVDAEWVGRRVFAFEPHADRFRVPVEDAVALPETVDTAAATMLPTVETATNLVLDGAPAVGERAVVFGAGPVGLATTHQLAAFPLSELVVVEPVAARREVAAALGADRTVPPADAPTFAGADPAGADLVYELSGRPATLDDAIDAAGYDARVVVGSWYGTKRAPVDLGGSFHRDRISVESSQVSTVAPERRGRWDHDRRLSVALERLAALPADRLITHRLPFADAAEAYRLLDDAPGEALQVVFTYR